MRRVPPLNWLRAFEAAARHLSFTAAAEELSITQSAVSQQIRSLEAHLGEPLFYRRGRRVSLTEAANRYYPAIHDSFDRIERSSAAFMRREVGKTVTVSSNISFLTNWLLPRLPDFQRRYPRLKLRLTTTRWSTDPRQTGAGVEIIYGDGSWSVPAEQLTQTNRFPVCSPSLLEKLGNSEKLAEMNLISNIGEEDLWQEWADSARIKLSRDRQAMSADLQLVALRLAVAGSGLAMANWLLACDRLREGTLCVPVKRAIPARDNYFLLYTDQSRKAVETGDFVEWLRDMVAKEEEAMAEFFGKRERPERHRY